MSLSFNEPVIFEFEDEADAVIVPVFLQRGMIGHFFNVLGVTVSTDRADFIREGNFAIRGIGIEHALDVFIEVDPGMFHLVNAPGIFEAAIHLEKAMDPPVFRPPEPYKIRVAQYFMDLPFCLGEIEIRGKSAAGSGHINGIVEINDKIEFGASAGTKEKEGAEKKREEKARGFEEHNGPPVKAWEKRGRKA